MLEFDLEKKERNNAKSMKKKQEAPATSTQSDSYATSAGNTSIIAQAFNESNAMSSDILNESHMAIGSVEPSNMAKNDSITTNMEDRNPGQIDNIVIVQDIANTLVWHTKNC